MQNAIFAAVVALYLLSAGPSGSTLTSSTAFSRIGRFGIGAFPSAALLQSENSGESALKPGDTLPQLAGQSLTGKPVDLPTSMGDRQIVLVVAFTHTAGHDSQNWGQHLSKDYPHLDIYNAIFLESAPKLVRPMAVAGIKSGIPAAMHDRAMILYRDESLWKKRLQVKDDSHAYVMLIDPGGRIRWMASGAFSDANYAALGKEVQTSN